MFAGLPEAKARGYEPGRFSFNVKGGRCEACEGDGVIKIEMHFLPDVYVTCDVCKGKRYNRETLEILFKGKSIADVLDMTVEEAAEFRKQSRASAKLETLDASASANPRRPVGDHALRRRSAAGETRQELSKRATGRTLYILDEPTTGLHWDDIKKLLDVLYELVEQGNTVVVIEHNLDVIKTADWVIDLGPEGGDGGGEIVATGTPEDIVKAPRSYTGKFLGPVLAKASTYRALGCRVTLAEQQERLLPDWDASVGERVTAELSAKGIELYLGRKVEVEKVPIEDGYPIIVQPDGDEISPDLVLVATGRRPNVESIGLESLGIVTNPYVEVDAQLKTRHSHIFAIGDVNGLNMLDSSASAQGRIAIEAICGADKLFSSRWVPRYLDTDPPVAAVGWMETDANKANFEVDIRSETVKLVTSEDSDVAEPSSIQVKLIVERQTKKIRGCVVVGNQAAEVINVAALAIQSNATTSDLERLLLVHPSAALALQRCAAKFQ